MLTKIYFEFISLILIVATPTLITAQCEQGNFLIHPESCEKFLLCISGVFFELTCPLGLQFNSAINECDCSVKNCIPSATIAGDSDAIRNCTTSAPNYVTDRFPISTLATGSDQIASIVNPYESTTYFNSGNYPPQWIQLKLPMLYTIHNIHLQVVQVPAGKTVHKLYVGTTSNPKELVTTLDGYTKHGYWFNLTYSPPLTNVQYLLLHTVTSPSWVAWNKFLIY